jgi:LAGLIDADG-like domain
MSWDYISGFFDADGSLTLTTNKAQQFKTVQLSFHNNELSILEEIRHFIENELGIKGSIATKKPEKEVHNVAYDLKYVYFSKVNRILSLINSNHPKKSHRIKISFELELVTPRNGKYNNELLMKRQAKEIEFLHISDTLQLHFPKRQFTFICRLPFSISKAPLSISYLFNKNFTSARFALHFVVYSTRFVGGMELTEPAFGSVGVFVLITHVTQAKPAR